MDKDTTNGSAKREIFKTESFYVENRDAKKMHAIKKTDEEFERVANKIDRHEEQRNNRKNQRIDRKHYFMFQKAEEGYQVSEVQKSDLPRWLKLGIGDILRNRDGSGYFRGNRLDLDKRLTELG
jgi:hypothetical protein